MGIRIPRGKSDKVLKKIVAALDPYAAEHTKAEIDVYRQTNVSVRIRIVDPDFAALDRVERDTLIWRYFDALSEEEQGDISTILLLTPKETKTSFANMEFDHPAPSRL